jgi:MoaA/NifB/PqqE/SkfB family radical SAM enzyme
MANNFCRFLSNGYRLVTNGYTLSYSPCCWWKTPINVDSPNFWEQKERINNITNWVPECGCRTLEESGVLNLAPRIRSFRDVPDASVPNNLPVWVELSIDTTCNAACLICGDYHSTTWRKQNIKYNLKRIDDLPDLVDPMHWLERIKRDFPLDNIETTHILGGEPFQTDITYEYLKYIKDLKGLENLSVTISTNGSTRPDPKLAKLLEECKIVRYLFSLDGTAEQFEYIRYPLNWTKTEDTVKFINTLPGNKMMNIISTVNPFNIFYYDRLEQWVKSLEPEVKFINVNPNRCIGSLDLAWTPIALREAIKEKYPLNHPISKMLSNLNHRDDYYNLLNYVELWDGNRKTNWRETFPDVVKYLDFNPNI